MREFCEHDPCGYHAKKKVGDKLLCGIHAYAQRKRKETRQFWDEVRATAQVIGIPLKAGAVSKREVVVCLDDLERLANE